MAREAHSAPLYSPPSVTRMAACVMLPYWVMVREGSETLAPYCRRRIEAVKADHMHRATSGPRHGASPPSRRATSPQAMGAGLRLLSSSPSRPSHRGAPGVRLGATVCSMLTCELRGADGTPGDYWVGRLARRPTSLRRKGKDGGCALFEARPFV
jgi:hypothetical protein